LNILVTQGGGVVGKGSGMGSSISRSNPLILYRFSKPLERSFKISF